MKVPTRQEVIELAQNLAAGKANPVEVAHWAQKFYYQENRETLELLKKEDPLLEDFIGTLVLADSITGKEGGLLYGIEDFGQWLKEFLRNTESEAKR